MARIFDFNFAFSLDRAEQVDARLIERAEALEAMPLVGRPTRILHVREISLPDIQYVLRYLVEDKHVTILRAHSTRERMDLL